MPTPAGARLTRALQHRNFRLFFGGQSVSLVGTWITRVATSWLIYKLTGSELLGVAGFAGQIPTLVITPLPVCWWTAWTAGASSSSRRPRRSSSRRSSRRSPWAVSSRWRRSSSCRCCRA
ncbi:MAG: hypothetical protein R2712_08365 [Vicinamibacterales bacterium]